MGTTQATKLVRAVDGASCDRCGLTDGVVVFWRTVEGDEPEFTPETHIIAVCAFCLAEGIGLATGFRAPEQLRSWFAARQLAQERAKRDAKSSYMRGYYAGQRNPDKPLTERLQSTVALTESDS